MKKIETFNEMVETLLSGNHVYEIQNGKHTATIAHKSCSLLWLHTHFTQRELYRLDKSELTDKENVIFSELV